MRLHRMPDYTTPAASGIVLSRAFVGQVREPWVRPPPWPLAAGPGDGRAALPRGAACSYVRLAGL